MYQGSRAILGLFFLVMIAVVIIGCVRLPDHFQYQELTSEGSGRSLGQGLSLPQMSTSHTVARQT